MMGKKIALCLEVYKGIELIKKKRMKVNWNELNIYISFLFSLVHKELNGMKSNFVWQFNWNESFYKKKYITIIFYNNNRGL